jgi:hypothetical protein
MRSSRRLFVSLLLAACSSGGEPATLPGADHVLARVGDSTITEYDLTQSIARTFGEHAPDLEDEARRKVLESLVTTRALARAREAELDAAGRAALEQDVASYREQRLMKQYLDAHAPPEPVSDAMIEAYYRQHPERFGGQKLRHYELITGRASSAVERDGLLSALAGAAQKSDLRAFSSELAAAGKPVSYASGLGNEAALHPRLRTLIEGLEVGKTSAVLFVEGASYVVRVTAIDEQPPRPLAEVREQIRDILTPIQLKKSIQVAGAQAVAAAGVEYSR